MLNANFATVNINSMEVDKPGFSFRRDLKETEYWTPISAFA